MCLQALFPDSTAATDVVNTVSDGAVPKLPKVNRYAFPESEEDSDDEATVPPPVTAAPATAFKLGSRVTIPYYYENGAVVLCFAHVYDPTQTADGEIAIIWDEHFGRAGMLK